MCQSCGVENKCLSAKQVRCSSSDVEKQEKFTMKKGLIPMASTDIGIDLGTASVLVYVRGKGIVLKEPSIVAYDKDTNEIRAIGEEARQMMGRTPGNIAAVRPLRHGVISDYTITEKMLRYFIQKAVGRKTIKRPRVCVGVPSGATEVEKNAVLQATLEAGARDVVIIEEPIAAALGSGIDISRPCGNMIIDIGGGTTDIAVISLGETVVGHSLKVAGDDFDDALIRYMKKQHKLLIGNRMAEEIKVRIGSAYKRVGELTMPVKGRDVLTGLPKTVEISSDETLEAFKEIMLQMLEAIHHVLEVTPPELAADIATRGILMTGGGSLLFGMDELLEETLGIRVVTADDPISVVAMGTGRYSDFIEGKQAKS